MLFMPDTSETDGYFGRLAVDYEIERAVPGAANITGVEFRGDGFGAHILEDAPFWYDPA